jgi:uncharacterized membrane protein
MTPEAPRRHGRRVRHQSPPPRPRKSMYRNVDVGRFIAIIILVVLAWNIIQTIQNALNNLYLKLTGSDINVIQS